MRSRPPLGVDLARSKRRAQAANKAERELRKRFNAAGVVTMILPPYIMAKVPMARFDGALLACFMLTPGLNTDAELPPIAQTEPLV